MRLLGDFMAMAGTLTPGATAAARSVDPEVVMIGSHHDGPWASAVEDVEA